MRRSKSPPAPGRNPKTTNGTRKGHINGLNLSQNASDGPCGVAAILNRFPYWRVLLGFGLGRARGPTAVKYRIDPINFYYQFE